MNNSQICEGICKLHDSIKGAAVIVHGSMVGMYSKPGTPVPSEERFKKIFQQTEIVSSINRSNEDFYGSLQFFTVHYEDAQLFFFPLDKYAPSRKKSILGFKIVQPYSHDEVVLKVSNFLRENITIENGQ